MYSSNIDEWPQNEMTSELIMLTALKILNFKCDHSRSFHNIYESVSHLKPFFFTRKICSDSYRCIFVIQSKLPLLWWDCVKVFKHINDLRLQGLSFELSHYSRYNGYLKFIEHLDFGVKFQKDCFVVNVYLWCILKSNEQVNRKYKKKQHI